MKKKKERMIETLEKQKGTPSCVWCALPVYSFFFPPSETS